VALGWIFAENFGFLANFNSTNFSTFINHHIIRRYAVSILTASLNNQLKTWITVAMNNVMVQAILRLQNHTRIKQFFFLSDKNWERGKTKKPGYKAYTTFTSPFYTLCNHCWAFPLIFYKLYLTSWWRGSCTLYVFLVQIYQRNVISNCYEQMEGYGFSAEW
jgi:hypothetical protein